MFFFFVGTVDCSPSVPLYDSFRGNFPQLQIGIDSGNGGVLLGISYKKKNSLQGE